MLNVNAPEFKSKLHTTVSTQSSGYSPSVNAYTDNHNYDYQPSQETWFHLNSINFFKRGPVIATQHGTMSIRFDRGTRVDMTVDNAIRIINLKSNIVMSLSASGASSALLHPNGRVYQCGSQVQIEAFHTSGYSRYAKMWHRGINFTTEKFSIVYLLDSAGLRTTSDTFFNMSQDFSLSVFYNESRHGVGIQEEAINLLQNAQYFVDDKDVQNWIINRVRISYSPEGLVRVTRNSSRYEMRTSAKNSYAVLTTPFLHTTASHGFSSHLFVRRGERRMHYNGTSFSVRNRGHSAGIDNQNILRVY